LKHVAAHLIAQRVEDLTWLDGRILNAQEIGQESNNDDCDKRKYERRFDSGSGDHVNDSL